MIGAIIGDIVGSRFEGMNRVPYSKNFKLFHKHCRFTDDTVMTIATCEAILNNKKYRDIYRKYYNLYPYSGYGRTFKLWARSGINLPYNSWGNGSAMRVSPVAYAFDSEEEVLYEAKKSASATHNHKEGIKGAQSVAMAIYLAKNGIHKDSIEEKISEKFGYNLRPEVLSEWDVSCQGCVPQAFCAFFESNDFEDCIRKAILKGGDSDTIASIAGAIAEPYYGIPSEFIKKAFKFLPYDLKNVVESFIRRHIDSSFYLLNKKCIFDNIINLFEDLVY